MTPYIYLASLALLTHTILTMPPFKLGRFFSTALKSSPTYYTLFPKTFPKGPPPAGPFVVPATDLRKEYLALQALAHPDRQGPLADDSQRSAAESRSSLLSVAYKTLLSPLQRAQHLIACREGVVDPLAEDAGSSSELEKAADTVSANGVIDEDFLMDVLVAREAAEDAASAEEIKLLLAENNLRIAQTEQDLDVAFKNDDLPHATNLTRQLSYWAGIDRQLQQASEEFD